MASRVAQWLRALYCSASCATRDPGFAPRLCRNRPRPEGLAGRDILVLSRTSDSCGRPGSMHANQGCQVHSVSSDTLVRLASGLDARYVKKQCGLVGLCRDETRY